MRRLALLVCALAFALPACGEDDDQQPAPAATATPTEETGDRGGYGY
jgi:hypothetical protein